MLRAMPLVCQTPRLTLRHLELGDAPFILEQLNEPSFIEFIADRGVRTIADAERYLQNGPLAMYAAHGVGLWLVEDRATHAPLGLCGLLHREAFEHRDLGYAFVPRAWGHGYALEAGQAVLSWARTEQGLKTIIAITSLVNPRSIRVLEKLGFVFEGLTPLGDEQVRRFTKTL
jgi:[ribosomal protein S5]-alanine N-acetyltransferase